MRRSTLVLVLALASLWIAPLRAGAETASSAPALSVAPTVETMVTGGTYSPVVTVRDGAGDPVSGIDVSWRVVDGGHAGDDVDGSEITPPGFIGLCQTNASGFCTVSYIGSRVTIDTVRALIDADHDGVADPGEPVATATIDWRAAGGGPTVVRLDMSGCDGDTTSPIDAATWNAAGPAMTVDGVRAVCAARFTDTDALAPGPVTFTVIGGPGVFTDVTGASNLGTVLVVQADDNVNKTFVRSTVSGTTTVRVSMGSTASDGTAAWAAGAARTITLAGPTNPASGSSGQVTATVHDRFANPVPDVAVVFSESGPGEFAAGTETVNATTGPTGTAAAADNTAAGQTGSQTVTATLSQASTDCDKAAGDPAGAPAGVCLAGVTLNWIEAEPALSLLVSPEIGVWGTQFAVSGTLTIGSSGLAGKPILVYSRPVGTGASAWSPIAVTQTDDSGFFVVPSTPSLHTEYRAAFAGDDSFAAAQSAGDRADVRVGLHFNQSAAALGAGRAVVFSGRILPEHPNHPVYLQQLTGAGWRTIASSRTDAGSWYQFRVAKRTAGGLLFRTVTPSDFHHAWNASLNRRVDWR